MPKRKTDRQKKFERNYGKLFKAFMEMEASSFGEKRREFILKVTVRKVKQFIINNCSNYVEIKTLTNLGLPSCSLTLDMFTNKGGKNVILNLCPCGTNFSAKTEDGEMLYTSACYKEYHKWAKATNK